MEVASPLTFGPGSAGNKRSLACSPQMNLTEMEMGDERATKRRRFHAADVDSLSEDFSSHSLFYKTLPPNKSIVSANLGKNHHGD
jgi:hypothetical protein